MIGLTAVFEPIGHAFAPHIDGAVLRDGSRVVKARRYLETL